MGKKTTWPGSGCKRRDAVVEVLVGAGAAAVNARQKGAGRQRDAGRERGKLHKVARVQRHRNHGASRDRGLDVAGLRLQERRVCSDLDGLLVAAHGERKINSDSLTHKRSDPGASEMSKA